MIFSEKPLMLAFSLKICSSTVGSTNPSQGVRIKRRRLALAINSINSTLLTLGRMAMRPWLSNESNFESLGERAFVNSLFTYSIISSDLSFRRKYSQRMIEIPRGTRPNPKPQPAHSTIDWRQTNGAHRLSPRTPKNTAEQKPRSDHVQSQVPLSFMSRDSSDHLSR